MRVLLTAACSLGFLLVFPTLGHPQDVTSVAVATKGSVGVILAEGSNGVFSGTGFMVGDSLVLTANHVVDGADQVLIQFPGFAAVRATVVQTDKNNDLAVLTVPLIGVRPLRIGDATRAREDQLVVVIGFPRIDVLGTDTASVTQGIVSAIRPPLLQIQAPVNPGNSGGPVLNLQGEVIGVVEGRIRGEQELNFAVSIDVAKPVLNRANGGRSPAPKIATSAIQNMLTAWVESFRSEDLNGQMQLYGPVLETYFTQKNVTWQTIYQDKRHSFERYPRAVEYNIRNVQGQMLSQENAVVTFNKSWDFRTADNGRFAGDERQRLKLRLMDGEWRIVSEEELIVYWVVVP